MLKPNRLVAMATTGKLAETTAAHHQTNCCGNPVSSPGKPVAPSDLLDSLTNGLRRLCELAFGPNQQVHELAAKAVDTWMQTVDLAVDRNESSGQIQDRHRAAVRLLTAVALYLELCRRDRSGSTTGVIETAALSRLMNTCEGHVPPEAAARCPALRRFLSHYQPARPATRRVKHIVAA